MTLRRELRVRSLRADLLIAAVAPLLIFALAALVMIYSISRIQLEGRVLSKLDTVATFLSDSAELGIVTRDSEALVDPAERALGDEDIVHVSIYDPEGQLLVVVGDTHLPPTTRADLGQTSRRTRPVALGGDLFELRRAIRYPVADGESEMLGFLHAPLGPGPGELQGYVRIVMSGQRVSAEYRGMMLVSLASMAVVLLLGGALALRLPRESIRGMMLLSRATRRIGQGELEVRVPEVGSGEVAELARAFNDMGGQLRAARDEIADHHERLEQKVEERTSELNEMRIEAERANTAKSQFLANMSHEIRTPMTAILGYTEVIQEADQLPSEASELLDIIARNGSHLLALINGILDLSKIEAGRLQIRPVPVDLAQIAVEVASAIRIRADERGIDLAVEFPSPLPTRVETDPVRVRQALMNLVGNAVKFTRRGSVRIQPLYDTEAGKACIRVIDTGVGIAQDAMPSLFLEFEQGDTSMSRRFGGTGLGLAITRRLSRLLGGDCSLESEEGVGTTASLTFDAPMSPGSELRIVRSEEQIRSEPPRSESNQDEGIEARILYAEDGPDNQRLISHHLRRVGADVQIAENGRIAVEMIRSDPTFDLVLMDMAMPEMDGYTAAHIMREMGVEIPIIAVTAHALEGERDKCIASGCDGYLSKPIKRGDLLQAVRDALCAREKETPA